MLIDITKIFVEADDFFKGFEQDCKEALLALEDKNYAAMSEFALSPSEVMAILIAFHMSNYRTFKHFYIKQVQRYWREAFPNLVSYPRFIALQKYVLLPLCGFLYSRTGPVTGISYIDSTPLIVCHNRRIKSHKVFNELAERGKNSVGWFYGFKLHIIVNDCGELLAVKVTPGNTNDRAVVPEMTQGIVGKLFGDKGYISQKLFEFLFENGLQLITRIKKHMNNKLMPIADKILLRKRSIIETINDQLKNISQIEHTRHRSIWGFMVNLICGLIAYSYREKKPSLKLNSSRSDLEVAAALPIMI